MNGQTQTLYRPVGLSELELIAAAAWKAFPPRLDWQPIFYPVMTYLQYNDVWLTDAVPPEYISVQEKDNADTKINRK